MTDRWDTTWNLLRAWTGGQPQSERLAAQVLLTEGYRNLKPSQPLGGPDGGSDALATRDGAPWVIAVYFPRREQSFATIRRKFLADSRGVTRNDAVGLAFVTNQELTVGQRRDLENAVEHLVDIIELEQLTAILDQPAMREVRQQFLGHRRDAQPTGGASGPSVSLAFDVDPLGLKVLDSTDAARESYLAYEQAALTERLDASLSPAEMLSRLNPRAPTVYVDDNGVEHGLRFPEEATYRRLVDEYIDTLRTNWQRHLDACTVELGIARVTVTCKNEGHRYLRDVRVALQCPTARLLPDEAANQIAAIRPYPFRPLPAVEMENWFAPRGSDNPKPGIAEWHQDVAAGEQRLVTGPVDIPPGEEVRLRDVHVVPVAADVDTVELRWTATSSSTDGRHSDVSLLAVYGVYAQLTLDHAQLEESGYVLGLASAARRGSWLAAAAGALLGLSAAISDIDGLRDSPVALALPVVGAALAWGLTRAGTRGLFALRALAATSLVAVSIGVAISPAAAPFVAVTALSALFMFSDDAALSALNGGQVREEAAAITVPLRLSRLQQLRLWAFLITPSVLGAVAALLIDRGLDGPGTLVVACGIFAGWLALNQLGRATNTVLAVSETEFIVRHGLRLERPCTLRRDVVELTLWAPRADARDLDLDEGAARHALMIRGDAPFSIAYKRSIATEYDAIIVPAHRPFAVLAHRAVAGPAN